MLFIDQGINDAWILPQHVTPTGPGLFTIALREPLGQDWDAQIVRYPLPEVEPGSPVDVACAGASVPSQWDGDLLALRVDGLRAGEERVFEVALGEATPSTTSGVSVTETPDAVLVDNGAMSLRLPASADTDLTCPLPGALLAVRRGQGPWLGQGRLETNLPCTALTTRVTESGSLWTTVEVTYTFAAGDAEDVCSPCYCVQFRIQPDAEYVQVRETSTLPVRLWPQPRPYREIGSLGGSHWAQPLEKLALPCLRPWPTSNFIFDLRAGWDPDRLITHSTASWELMDLPLASPVLKTYTAMRASNPFMDGGWLGVYATGEDLVGVASLDIAHWGVPDETLHPAHRTAGASEEVILLDGAQEGTFLKFPVENIKRRWLLAVAPAAAAAALQPLDPSDPPPSPDGPRRQAPDPTFSLWRLRRCQGDLRLDKVKDWILDWPEGPQTHPRVLCNAADLSAIREKIRSVPELLANYEATQQWRSADRYVMTGEASGLAAIEETTHGREIVETLLAQGYTAPNYCIALARPLRRYALACDVQWDSFTAEERREARRVCALAAYILSDGDWWQYALTPAQTTYLPNFNTDVFCCAGLIGLVLADHPCSGAWVQFLVDRLELDLEYHLRLDGGGEENVGNYLISTWGQLLTPALWGLRHCGIKDYSDDPRVRAGARFLLRALGPPDPRDGGRRQMPPIGHHPGARKSPFLFAWLAAFVKDSDPSLAANLMWAWRQVGSPVANFYDHSGITANPLTRHYLFHDPTIPEVAPRMESHELPYVGAVLRSHDRSGQGSYLFLKAGRVHSHHEDDEGSLHWFARGVPLAVDGLPLMNVQVSRLHNVVSFEPPGQPTMVVEHFAVTPGADYVRGRMAPGAYCAEGMNFEGVHHSGFTREIIFVKSPQPGGIEYAVLRDTCAGPDAPQWNLDVLSRKPRLLAPGHVWFPGHPELDMGLEVFMFEPTAPQITFESGPLQENLLTTEGRAKLKAGDIDWTIIEHWLMHVPAAPGATFTTVLFPRRPAELTPEVEYLPREQVLRVVHPEGQDLLFLRTNPGLQVSLDGVVLQGRAGLARKIDDEYILHALDAERMEFADWATSRILIA